MKKSLVIVLVLMTFGGKAVAQSDSLRIFYSNGNAHVITGGLKKAVQRDMFIVKGQVLKLGKNSSVILIATNGTALPLYSEGSYPFKKLLRLLYENSSSLTNRYFTYVVQQMTETHEKPEDKLTGGVYRAEKLMYMPFDSCLVIQNRIRFSWMHSESSEMLFLSIREQYSKDFLSIPLRDTTYTYETKPGNSDRIYNWSVGSEPEHASNVATRIFTVASMATVDRLKRERAEIEKNLHHEPEFNALILLNFYDRNYLFIEENTAIANALAKYPNSTLIHEYYAWFLKKCGTE